MASNPLSSPGPGAGSGSGEVRSLVVRAWHEPGTPPQIRARLVEIAPGRGERTVLVTTSVDDACQAVRNWLEALRAPDATENGDGAVTPGG